MRGILAFMCCCLPLLCFAALPTASAAPPVLAGPPRTADLDALLADIERAAVPGTAPVKLIAKGKSPGELLPALAGTGGHVAYVRGEEVQINVPARVARLLVERLPADAVVRLPYPHVSTDVVSQGVAVTGAGSLQELGGDGVNVRVGIIDLGFGALASAQNSGDLPLALSATDYSATGIGGTSHGTQVAEIVHDMAPAAALYLAKISTSLELAQAVDDMVAAGVDVIVHSVAWFGSSFNDGTGPLCGITDHAAAAGILWVNSVGNHRLKHYSARFSDTDNDLRHNFSAGNGNGFQLKAGQEIRLLLNWDDYPATGIDYALRLYFGDPAAGGVEVASADTRQRGSQSPMEYLAHTAASAGSYHVVVSKLRSSMPDVPFSLFVISGPNLAEWQAPGSLTQPSDCAAVIAVGATNLADAPEAFSSEGPTTDGRAKPEIAGPNRVVTSLSGSFAGTSAAAPHVGGALALLSGRNPDMDAAQLRGQLLDEVHDVHVAGFDFRTGAGRVSLDADGDGFNQDDDNCPLVDNPDQADRDGNGAGDVCEPPRVGGIWPGLGGVGTFVYIFGEYLATGGSPVVTFNGIPSTGVFVMGDGMLIAVVPPGDTVGEVRVSTTQGSAPAAVVFGQSLSGLQISGVWPAGGARVGELVYVFGAGFGVDTVAYLGTQSILGMYIPNSQMLAFFVPPGSVSGPLTVSSGGQAVVRDFQVLP